jgi:hypothetical protein
MAKQFADSTAPSKLELPPSRTTTARKTPAQPKARR